MRMEQHVYFAVFTRTLHPDAISERLGMRPDEAKILGSRLKSPPRPTAHWWQVRCDEQLPVDEQIHRVIDRMAQIESAVGELVDELKASEGKSAGSVLRVV